MVPIGPDEQAAPEQAGDPPAPREPIVLRSPRPLLARLTAPPGPAEARLVERAGAAVLALPGRYCVNYLLIGPDAVVVVDVGSHADLPGIFEALRWLGKPRSAVGYVLPTHLHMDHVMGVDALASALRAPVALGRVACEHVNGGRVLRWPGAGGLLRASVTYFMQGAPRPALSDACGGLDFGFPWARNRFRADRGPVLDHGDPLPALPGWTVLATPGHADDAICLHHEAARFLVAGDTVRNFLGGEWNPLVCDRKDYERSQAVLRGLAVETIFPGHGPVIDRPDAVKRLKSHPFYVP